MAKGLGRVKFRTLAQVKALFGDLELIPPDSCRCRRGVPIPARRRALTTARCWS